METGSEPEHPDATVRVLVVDDETDVRDMVSVVLAADDRIEVVGHARDGAEAVTAVASSRPHVVVMDVNMPLLDGCAATELIIDAHPDVRIVALTGQVEPESVMRMVLAGAVGYAVKGSDPAALAEVVIAASHSENFVDPAALPGLFESMLVLAREERRRRAQAEQLAQDLEEAYRDTVSALLRAIRYRDAGTEAHGDRVAQRVVEVGRRLGLDAQQLTDIEYAAMFHDIGKIAVPDSILHNVDELSESEWDVIRQHTVVGEQILKPVGFLRRVAPLVRHSHEHWDGSGYPDGLAGEEIPIESRIVFACDAFDAMTSERSYQRMMTVAESVDRMHELSGIHFDPRVVDALVEVLAAEGVVSGR